LQYSQRFSLGPVEQDRGLGLGQGDLDRAEDHAVHPGEGQQMAAAVHDGGGHLHPDTGSMSPRPLDD
jgi:hypothetical protein